MMNCDLRRKGVLIARIRSLQLELRNRGYRKCIDPIWFLRSKPVCELRHTMKSLELKLVYS